MERVTLYIPFKESRESLEQVLGAVLRSTYPIDQLILVDDGSISFEPNFLRALAPRAQIIRHEKNLGVAAARNSALAAATNNLIASFDADIVPDEECLSRLISAMAEDVHLSGAGGRVTERFHDTPGDLFRTYFMKQDRGEATIECADLFGGCTVYRRSALLAVGGYCEMLRNSFEDFDISRRVQQNGGKTRYVPDALATHIKRDSLRSAIDTLYRWSYPHWESNSQLTTHRWVEKRIEYPPNYYEKAVSTNIETLVFKMRGDLTLALGRMRECLLPKLLIPNLIYPVRSVLHDGLNYRLCEGPAQGDVVSLLCDTLARVLAGGVPEALGQIIFSECHDLLEKCAGKSLSWREFCGYRSPVPLGQDAAWPGVLAATPAGLPAQTFIEMFSTALHDVSVRGDELQRELREWGKW